MNVRHQSPGAHHQPSTARCLSNRFPRPEKPAVSLTGEAHSCVSEATQLWTTIGWSMSICRINQLVSTLCCVHIGPSYLETSGSLSDDRDPLIDGMVMDGIQILVFSGVGKHRGDASPRPPPTRVSFRRPHGGAASQPRWQWLVGREPSRVGPAAADLASSRGGAPSINRHWSTNRRDQRACRCDAPCPLCHTAPPSTERWSKARLGPADRRGQRSGV